jgi:hypothetical protein
VAGRNLVVNQDQVTEFGTVRGDGGRQRPDAHGSIAVPVCGLDQRGGIRGRSWKSCSVVIHLKPLPQSPPAGFAKAGIELATIIAAIIAATENNETMRLISVTSLLSR